MPFFYNNLVMHFKKESLMKSLIQAVLAVSLALSAATAVYAQSAQTEAAAADSMSTGEVKKVDKSAGKITIKHGPLKNLGMDAMTMVFRVQKPGMLDQIKAGDKLNFIAEQSNGQLTVSRLQKLN
jgi:Cu(I)/Ag(I) efflux system periplasmic protein CusF